MHLNQRIFGPDGRMRRQNYVFEPEQDAAGRRRFFGQNIERRPTDPFSHQRPQQRVLVDDPATACVDDDRRPVSSTEGFLSPRPRFAGG